jgi:hypothetical protein
MKFYVMVAMSWLGFMMPALACYSPAEQAAEQGVRLHSELMVISVTCRYGSYRQNLPQVYRQFTQRNLGLIKGWESTMMNYYKKEGGGGEAGLNRLRTVLSNEASQIMANMGAPSYCEKMRDKVVAASAWNPKAIQAELQRMNGHYPTTAPTCR